MRVRFTLYPFPCPTIHSHQKVLLYIQYTTSTNAPWTTTSIVIGDLQLSSKLKRNYLSQRLLLWNWQHTTTIATIASPSVATAWPLVSGLLNYIGELIYHHHIFSRGFQFCHLRSKISSSTYSYVLMCSSLPIFTKWIFWLY